MSCVGLHGYQTRHIRLVALLVLLCFAAGLVQRITLSPRSASTPLRHKRVQRQLNPPNLPAPRPSRIHGRWEAVRASLGLPPLPHEAVPTFELDSVSAGRHSAQRPSRFDLGRMRGRQAAEATLKRQHFPPLHFAPDTRRRDTPRRSDRDRHLSDRPDQSMKT